MFIIGLTGGIGSGKSTIASWFRDWHIPVIDGDKLAREAVNPGSPVLSILADAFGKEILSEEGTLKRRQLGQIVFQDKAKLSRLNQIMHPAIWHLVESRIKACKDAGEKLAVLDMPLLIEAGWQSRVDSVWVVYVSMEVQISRVMKRDGLKRSQVMAIMQNQIPVEEKLSYADVIINNEGSEENTRRQVLQELSKISEFTWQK